MKYINMIGAEIEAAYTTEDFRGLRDWAYLNGMVELHDDGSINVEDMSYQKEAVTQPTANMAVFEKVIKDLYTFNPEVNDSCGLHFHISLKKESDYMRLLNYKFYKFFERQIAALAKRELTKRLDGSYSEKYHSEKGFNTDTMLQYQDSSKSSYRYRAVNYCYNLHGTVEFRVFNACKTAQEVLFYANFLIDCVEFYLDTIEKKPLRIKQKLIENMGTIEINLNSKTEQKPEPIDVWSNVIPQLRVGDRVRGIANYDGAEYTGTVTRVDSNTAYLDITFANEAREPQREWVVHRRSSISWGSDSNHGILEREATLMSEVM